MGSSGLQEGTGVGWLDTVLSASSVKGQVALCLAVSRREGRDKVFGGARWTDSQSLQDQTPVGSALPTAQCDPAPSGLAVPRSFPLFTCGVTSVPPQKSCASSLLVLSSLP